MSDSSNREIQRLWRIQKTIKEIVNDRNYLVAQAELDMSLEDFTTSHVKGGSIDGLDFIVESRDVEGEQMLIFFTEDESVGIKPVKKMIAQSIMKAVFIYQKSLTPSAKKVIQEMMPKYNIELFQEAELLVNITKHILVPKHIVLSATEKQTLLQRYRLKDSQLPRIQPTDPVARYYGLKRGQVVKIVRPSETAGKYVTYRLCW